MVLKSRFAEHSLVIQSQICPKYIVCVQFFNRLGDLHKTPLKEGVVTPHTCLESPAYGHAYQNSANLWADSPLMESLKLLVLPICSKMPPGFVTRTLTPPSSMTLGQNQDTHFYRHILLRWTHGPRTLQPTISDATKKSDKLGPHFFPWEWGYSRDSSHRLGSYWEELQSSQYLVS